MDEQELVASTLRSMPPPEVAGDFVARVNARIDAADQGWLGLTDFRVWTLRLAPIAAALALVAAFWSAPAQTEATTSAATVAAASPFSPASVADWERDVSSDALLDAALTPRGGSDAR